MAEPAETVKATPSILSSLLKNLIGIIFQHHCVIFGLKANERSFLELTSASRGRPELARPESVFLV